jgi:hypothetical protein
VEKPRGKPHGKIVKCLIFHIYIRFSTSRFMASLS